jgi:hypothetical protein
MKKKKKKKYLNPATGIVQALPQGFFLPLFLLYPFPVSSAKKRKWNKGKEWPTYFSFFFVPPPPSNAHFYWASPHLVA